MTKKKFLKVFGFSSLAVMMAAAGVFAFAPLGNSMPAAQNNAEAEVAETLITPKADDPVIATLEGGLEIKWGEAAVINGGGKETATYTYSNYTNIKNNISVAARDVSSFGQLTSGNLSGFPYFTTVSGSTTYTWVIIGRNSNVTMPSNAYLSANYSASKIEYKTLTDWQAKINLADQYQNHVDGYSPTYKSFFNNTYETSSPAGAAIDDNGLLSSQAARNYTDSATYSGYNPVNSNVKVNAEIPSGCVLVLANSTTTTSVWGGWFGSWYFATWSSWLSTQFRSTFETYYNSSQLGLSAIKSRIQARTLNTYEYNYRNSSWAWRNESLSSYIFPLGENSSCTYYYGTYLTAAQMKLTVNQALRGGNCDGGSSSGGYHWHGYRAMNTSGGHYNSSGATATGVRPAFVLKVT